MHGLHTHCESVRLFDRFIVVCRLASLAIMLQQQSTLIRIISHSDTNRRHAISAIIRRLAAINSAVMQFYSSRHQQHDYYHDYCAPIRLWRQTHAAKSAEIKKKLKNKKLYRAN